VECFGPDTTARFLALNGLKLLIRSHQAADEGCEVLHNGQCVTVFSASNYCGNTGNLGAVVKFDCPISMEPRYEQYMAITGFLPVYDNWTEYSETTAVGHHPVRSCEEEQTCCGATVYTAAQPVAQVGSAAVETTSGMGEQPCCNSTPEPTVQSDANGASPVVEIPGTSDITAVEAAMILVELHTDQTAEAGAPEPLTEACAALEDFQPMQVCDCDLRQHSCCRLRATAHARQARTEQQGIPQEGEAGPYARLAPNLRRVVGVVHAIEPGVCVASAILTAE
jgi:hypothetical protein